MVNTLHVKLLTNKKHLNNYVMSFIMCIVVEI